MAVLIRQLPRESATIRKVGGERTLWGDLEHLMATTVDLLAAGNWQRGGGKGSRPKPLYRPGSEGLKRLGRAIPLPEAKQLFERWRRGELDRTEEA